MKAQDILQEAVDLILQLNTAMIKPETMDHLYRCLTPLKRAIRALDEGGGEVPPDRRGISPARI